MFTDRDGKYQLGALAESGFDPLARTTQFMLTEEAHHLFVGETGVGRVITKTAELMKSSPNEDVRPAGGIPIDIVQKYINEWFSASLDLFGSEDSSNAAAYFATGLKGRFKESTSPRITDHKALEGAYVVEKPQGETLTKEEIPLLRAMNLVLRDAYVEDCQRAVERWNGTLAAAGHSFRITLPSDRFNRTMGLYVGLPYRTDGEHKEGYYPKQDLPTDADRTYVRSLMKKEYTPGKYASWIAPPSKGINAQAVDFEYVKFEART
jgi:benzoyl-CoA 2,3-dioxygenase component B